MAESADAQDLKSCAREGIRVQFPSPAPAISSGETCLSLRRTLLPCPWSFFNCLFPGGGILIISPFLRIFSAYNRVWFEVQRTLKWSKSRYEEPVAGTLNSLNAQQSERIRQLKSGYPVVFENQFRQSLALTNYHYLDLLDRTRREFQWQTEPGLQLVDVGSQNFYYAVSLRAFFQPQQLTGIEVEGYRIYQDGYSRFDYATAYIHGLPNTHYRVMDFCEFDERVDGITCFYPFLEPKALVRWRLPLKIFRPDLLVQTMARVLRPQGFVFMVNRGEAESAVAKQLMANASLQMVGQWTCFDPLTPWNGPPVVSLWIKSDLSFNFS